MTNPSADGHFTVALIGHSDPHVPHWVAQRLRDAGVRYAQRMCHSPQEIIELAHDADVVWTMGSNMAIGGPGWREVIRQALPGLTRCAAIVRSGSGTDNIPVEDATARNILVVNTPQATAEPVAEYTVALMLAAGRQVASSHLQTRQGSWPIPEFPTQQSLVGKTVGLVGFGHIARLVARNLGGFKVRILACDPLADAATMLEHGAQKVQLDELLEQSDYISLHCPLLPETRGLISHAQLARMKPHAILINTSRGEVVDEQALIASLQDKRLGGAALDVLEHEPPSADHPLLRMDNVIVTPHVAAFSEQIFAEMWRLSVESILDLAAGRRPRSCVNQVDSRWPLKHH